jgi:ABC-type long-subunit fatty acid transport system fused permease/ATPase subunit
MSYPLEKDKVCRVSVPHSEYPSNILNFKGKAFGIFWAIFQFGAFIGSLIALAINIRKGGLSAVSTSTYIAFLVIIFVGVASTWLLLPPTKVVRSDGTVPTLEKASHPRDEVINFLRVCKDWRMLALIPMFFASNYFYAYQGAVNAFYFDGECTVRSTFIEFATYSVQNRTHTSSERHARRCWRYCRRSRHWFLRPRQQILPPTYPWLARIGLRHHLYYHCLVLRSRLANNIHP